KLLLIGRGHMPAPISGEHLGIERFFGPQSFGHLYQLMIDGEHRQFNPVRYAEFVEDSSEVMFDGVFTDVKGLGDILVDLTFNNRSNDLEFAACESHGLGTCQARTCWSVECFQEI